MATLHRREGLREKATYRTLGRITKLFQLNEAEVGQAIRTKLWLTALEACSPIKRGESLEGSTCACEPVLRAPHPSTYLTTCACK